MNKKSKEAKQKREDKALTERLAKANKKRAQRQCNRKNRQAKGE